MNHLSILSVIFTLLFLCSCDNHENIYFEVEKHCDEIKTIRSEQDSIDCLIMGLVDEIRSLCDEIEDDDLRESIDDLAMDIYCNSEENNTGSRLEDIESCLLKDIEPLLDVND